jgi:hypothetical protein
LAAHNDYVTPPFSGSPSGVASRRSAAGPTREPATGRLRARPRDISGSVTDATIHRTILAASRLRGAATFYKNKPYEALGRRSRMPGPQVQRLNLRGYLILDDELIPVPAIHRSGLRDLDMALRATFACCSQVCATCSWRDLSHNLKHLDQVVPRVPSPRTPRCVCSRVSHYPAAHNPLCSCLPGRPYSHSHASSAVPVRSFARANALEPPVAEISYLGHPHVLAHSGESYYRQVVRTC